MVGVINAYVFDTDLHVEPIHVLTCPRNRPAKNKSRTIDSFTALAAQAPDNVSPSVGATSGGTDGSTPSGTSGPDASGTNTGATASFTGAANIFANRPGTLASLGITGVLGLFVAFL